MNYSDKYTVGWPWMTTTNLFLLLFLCSGAKEYSPPLIRIGSVEEDLKYLTKVQCLVRAPFVSWPHFGSCIFILFYFLFYIEW